MDLKNKTIVITGAARGLGAAMARRLAGHGTRLALVDLEADSLADCSAACEAAGATVKSYGANVAKEGDVIDPVAFIGCLIRTIVLAGR